MYKKKISIILTSFNSEVTIKNTLDSISKQTNKNFELIIIDGKSNDETVKIINSYKNIINIFVSEKDLGIYDAINKGINLSSCDYYLVVGSDDILFEKAIEMYLFNLEESIDILTANFFSKKKLYSLKKGPLWLYGPKNYVVGHSLGSLIRKDLHKKYGFYSLDFKIASDTFFLLKVIRGNSSIIHCNEEIGIFGSNGISNKKYFSTSFEHMLAHYKSGSNIFVQLILFTIKQIYFVIRYYILGKIF